MNLDDLNGGLKMQKHCGLTPVELPDKIFHYKEDSIDIKVDKIRRAVNQLIDCVSVLRAEVESKKK